MSGGIRTTTYMATRPPPQETMGNQDYIADDDMETENLRDVPVPKPKDFSPELLDKIKRPDQREAELKASKESESSTAVSVTRESSYFRFISVAILSALIFFVLRSGKGLIGSFLKNVFSSAP